MNESVVGIVGLGQMGSAMATHLRAAGFTVVGHDIDAARVAAFEQAGGRPAANAREVADAAAVVITSLPSEAALRSVLTGKDGLLQAARDELVIVETSTLSLEAKEEARAAAAEAGATLLDCPLSGTAAQAQRKDVVVYASGDGDAIERCVPVFEGFARAYHRIGAFGLGSKMKYLANLLVAIHNVAAAEAMVLAIKAGLDLQTVYDVISSGAGSSRMFEVRGPAMVAGDYASSGIAGGTFEKDLRIIADFARSLHCPVPLFSASMQYHLAAIAQGLGDQDTASVCAVLERLAGAQRAESG